MALHKLLVVFGKSVAICSLHESHEGIGEEDFSYQFNSEIGGACFLRPEIRCIVTQPRRQMMYVCALSAHHLDAESMVISTILIFQENGFVVEQEIPALYHPFVSLFHRRLSANECTRHFVSVSIDSTTFAIGGLDGTIHIYDWRQQISPVERGIVNYSRTFITPRSITFSFMHGSQFLVVGGEDETAIVYNLAENRRIGTLEHQSECGVRFYSI
jgi:hypothetical protein